MLRWLQVILSEVDRGAWIRFFIAIFGLGLAFAAAIYSTIFRDQGNFFATAFLASLALLLAGIVGIAIVPYLFKRVARRRLRERFHYDFTREGAVYLVVVMIVGLAALNTGNNLLFIVVSAMLGAFLVSGVASAGMLCSLELQLSLPVHVFARRPLLGRVALRNQRWWLPAFSISVTPWKRGMRAKRKWQRGIFAWPPNRPAEKQWIRLTDWVWKPVQKDAQMPEILSGQVYFSYIPRRSDASAQVELNFPRRGRYMQETLNLATRFPFSFLVKTRPVGLSQGLTVYPAVEQADEFFQVLPMIMGEFEMYVRGRGNNLYLIREHMPEDSARHVDWKATAKTGTLKVREFTREDERKLRIIFDNPAPGDVNEQLYENAVSLAASLAWYFAQGDTQLSFVAVGYAGSDDVYDFLEYLAVVSPAGATRLIDDLPLTDDYNVIITARPHGSIPTSLWASSYFLFVDER